IVAVPLVHLFRINGGKRVEQLAGPAVEDELQQESVGAAEYFHPRRLVHPPRLDADKAVLDQMLADADAVLAAELVGERHGLEGCRLLSVDGYGATLLEADGHRPGHVRRLRRMHPHDRLHETWRR